MPSVYTWGTENPKNKIGGARFDAYVLPPSVYDRDLLTARKGSRYHAKSNAPTETGRGSRLHRGVSAAGTTTPSASAAAIGPAAQPPSAYDRNLLMRRSAPSPYTNIRPRTVRALSPTSSRVSPTVQGR